MLTLEQAKSIFTKIHPDMIMKNFVDYNDIYVIVALPKSYNEEEEGIFDGGYYSVDKESGKVMDFAPWTDDKFCEEVMYEAALASLIP